MRHLTRALVVALITAAVTAVPAAGGVATRHHPTRLQQLEARYEPYKGCVGYHGSKTEPFYCSRFAVPACIVMAESRGLVHEHSHPSTSSGLYQITGGQSGSWALFGGLKYAPLPYEASKLDQSIVATSMWNHTRGASNWTTAARCGY
jgi:Transglycosylase-like domain